MLLQFKILFDLQILFLLLQQLVSGIEFSEKSSELPQNPKVILTNAISRTCQKLRMFGLWINIAVFQLKRSIYR